MALTRKSLKAMGLTDEQVDSIVEMHTETVEALKEQRDSFKAEADKLPAIRAEYEQLKAAAAENDGKNPFEVKYNALKEEYEKFKSDIAEKETARQTKEAYKELLKSAGVSEKRIDSVLKVTDLKALKLGADGKFEDAENLTNSIKSEWADFITTEGSKGAEVSNPPKKDPSVDYEKLSDEEYYRQTYEAGKKK